MALRLAIDSGRRVRRAAIASVKIAAQRHAPQSEPADALAFTALGAAGHGSRFLAGPLPGADAVSTEDQATGARPALEVVSLATGKVRIWKSVDRYATLLSWAGAQP